MGFPMMRPATAVEAMETDSRLTALGTGFSKQFQYPMSLARALKTMLTAVKPKKWVASGLSTKVKTVAMTLVTVTAPTFLAHHNARISKMTPIMPHRNGM